MALHKPIKPELSSSYSCGADVRYVFISRFRGLTLRHVSRSLSLLLLLLHEGGLWYIARFLSCPSIQREQVRNASWLSHRGLAQVEEVCLSWSLHQIEVSIFPPSEIPKAVPRWIHFTPGNSFLSMWVHDRLTGRRRRHGTFKPPSNNGFVISQRTAASSQSQPLPFSNFISSAASLSLLVFLSVFPHRRRPPQRPTPYLALFLELSLSLTATDSISCDWIQFTAMKWSPVKRETPHLNKSR